MAALSLGGIVAVSSLVTLVLLVYMIRDRVDLVKAVFEGVGLIASHQIVGTGCYMAGRATKGPPGDA